jgi:hypothetical protein
LYFEQAPHRVGIRALTPAQERRVIEEDLVSSRTKTLTTALPGRGGAGNAIVQEAKKELDIGAPSGN